MPRCRRGVGFCAGACSFFFFWEGDGFQEKFNVRVYDV